MQISTEPEQNVSCLNRLPLVFADNCQVQNSGLGLLANAQNILITGGTIVVVSFFCELYNQLITVYILSEQYSTC